MKSRPLIFFIVAVVLSLLVAAVFGFQSFRSKILKKVLDEMPQPPASITTILAKKEQWSTTLSAIATLSAYQGVQISAEEAGKVVKLQFESGSFVKKGTPLLQQDISVEEAELKSIEAQWKLAEITLQRIGTLLKEQASTQAEFDDAQSKMQQISAQYESLKSSIERKTIRAPFQGRLGIRSIQIGQYLTPGTPIVSLQALDPIYVDFTLPQVDLDQIKVGQSIEVSIDTFPNKKFKGSITAIEPQIDPLTRNIKIQGTLSNESEELRPGMFSTVQIELGSSTLGIVIPQTAIQYAPYGDSVFIVETMQDPTGKSYKGVRQQFVKLGPKKGDLVLIQEGIKQGEEIATTGVFKLRPNVSVSVNNQVLPDVSAQPSPANQ